MSISTDKTLTASEVGSAYLIADKSGAQALTLPSAADLVALSSPSINDTYPLYIEKRNVGDLVVNNGAGWSSTGSVSVKSNAGAFFIIRFDNVSGGSESCSLLRSF